MPVLDTVVLFAAADEGDEFHHDAMRRLVDSSGEMLLGASALFEFDLVLRSRGRNAEQRSDLMLLLLNDFPRTATAVHPISPSTLALASQLEVRFELDYFDALVASEALEHDGKVISTDRDFDKIPGLRRIPLASRISSADSGSNSSASS